MSRRDRPAERLSLYGVGAGVLIAIAGLLVIVSPTDPDVFWHLKNGEVTLASGFSVVDAYSFTARGRPWIAHEWLFDVAIAFATKMVGYRAAVMVAGIVQALTTWLFVRLARARGAGQGLALALTAVFLVFIAPTWGVRAQLVTAPLAGAFYLILLRYRRDPSRPRALYALPPLMLAWTNLHASFALGFAILAIFLGGGLAERLVYRAPASKLPLRPLLYAGAACALVTLANPVGLRLWTYPLPYLFSGTPDIRVIQEWQSVDFHHPENLVFAAALWVFGIVGLGRPVTRTVRRRFRLRMRARFDLIDLTLFAFATTMGLRYGRLVPLYGMLVLPLLGEGIARTWPALSRRAELVATNRSVARPFDYALACVLVTLFGAVFVCAPDAQLGREPRTDARFPYPADAVSFLERVASPGAPPRVFNEYGWGGYLLYRLYPRATVFIDGRADLYRDRIFDEYGAIHELAPGYRDTLAKSGSDFVLMRPDSLLVTALGSDAGWRRVFSDNVAVLFQRATPER